MKKFLSAILSLGCVLAMSFGPPQVHGTDTRTAKVPTLEIGIDRSNMATEWTLSPPAEPNIYPFNGPYNGEGIFEARRVAIYDGIARLHP